MKLPVQIAYRNVEHSDAIEALVRQRAAKLDTFLDRIMACRVMLEAPHRHQRHGRDYHCRIDLTVPGGEVVVAREPTESTTHQDLYAAVDAAFDVAQRRLEDFTRRARGDVKSHEAQPQGTVVRMSKVQSYGFIESAEGYEVYFHRNSVLPPGFDALQVGSVVRYAEEAGESGPQASTVAPTRRTRKVAAMH